MKRPLPMLFALQELTSHLSLVERNHHILDSERLENDIEHSFTVALLCWYVHSHLNLSLNLERMFKYALVHDFAERYAGDVNTFASSKDRAGKIKKEQEAVSRLSKELVEFPDLVQTLQSYETKADEEALLVWTVDKMQALILADLDNWRPYKKINITYTSFSKKHHEQLANCSPYCKDIFESLLEYCKTTYYDRPR